MLNVTYAPAQIIEKQVHEQKMIFVTKRFKDLPMLTLHCTMNQYAQHMKMYTSHDHSSDATNIWPQKTFGRKWLRMHFRPIRVRPKLAK